MYSELDFVLLAESIRDVHLQGLIREVYSVSMDCLKEKNSSINRFSGTVIKMRQYRKRGGRGGDVQDNCDNACYQVGDRRNDSKEYDREEEKRYKYLLGRHAI